ncbi:MAG: PHP domain-containing protein [Chlamydiota bacterium]
MDNRYDLHTHTKKSDGTHTPQELLYLAKESGLQGISITDHDTTDAYTKDLFLLAEKLRLKLFTGVEITAHHRCLNVHILAYGFDVKDRSFQEFLSSVREKRAARNEQIFAYLQTRGVSITMQDFEKKGLASSSVIGRLHIAEVLREKKYVSSLQEAFLRYLDDRARPWEKSPKFAANEVIEAIHQAGGKAVLAHPFFLKEGLTLQELLGMDFDGIEARYANIPAKVEKRWQKLGQKKSWIITGGSDFHGEVKPEVSLGASWSPETTIQALFYT